jgi:hypothetical protein
MKSVPHTVRTVLGKEYAQYVVLTLMIAKRRHATPVAMVPVTGARN